MRRSLLGLERNPRPHRLVWTVLSLLIVPIIVTGMLLTAGCENCDDASKETHEDSFAVGDSARVVVKTANGGISVTAGSGNAVQVVTTLTSPEKLAYSVIQDGSTITVEAKPKAGRTWGACMAADIVVTAPTMTDVDLHTSNGAITVEGINGSGVIETSNGAIDIFNVKGDFRGDTSNGALDIDGIEGSAELRTSNGAIDVRNAVGEVNLQTTNGRVSFDGELSAGSNNRLVTSNGRVDVELPGSPSVSLDASTSNGEINITLPITTSLVEKDHIVGTIAGGEADLYIRTSNGDVTIR
jgi:DUF4097 and DUF4098 domain-containing protein YvlB